MGKYTNNITKAEVLEIVENAIQGSSNKQLNSKVDKATFNKLLAWAKENGYKG